MTNKYYVAAWLALGVAALPHLAKAQASLVQKKELGTDGQPTLVEFSAAGRATLAATDGAQVLRQQLNLGANEQMRPAKLETDQLGFSHQKFDQYYKGVKIEHATYTVHSRANQVQSISGDYEAVPTLSVQPSLSADAALAKALAFVGAKKYMWQDGVEEAGLKLQANSATATYRPMGDLVLVRDNRQNAEGDGPLVLAWKFNVYAQQPVSRTYIYVDANTGDIVLRDAIIKHATGATATFATAYSGTRSLATETATGGYHLREYTRGLGIETYNCKKSNSYTAATDFVDADNNWTAAEYNNANYDNVAGDAHFGAQATYDYWKGVHARNSYDNAGAKIKSYVHFDDVPGGAGYENAYWDGTEMTYGDGASTFKPLTALDVCGHEIGHAVCEKTANLTYANESGAMNEGLSDIWGASVEKYTCDNLGLTKSTWDIGEDIMKAGGALRSMSNPNLYGQPALYKGKYWAATTTAPSNANDQGGVHTNSGVLNYWYYLISMGKSGTNESGNAYSVAALGISAAAKITFRMESVYMTASSTYANARTYSIQAATDLYGAGSTQVQAVTNAWYAVGVGAAYGGTTPPPTTTAYCTSKGTSQAYEYIDLVKLGTGINRTSAANGGYYDGTALSTSVAAGSSQTISFSAGFTGSAYTEYWKIFIDYNQDGDFADTGETIVSGSSASTGTLTSTFTVPTTAKTGKTRLRVVMSDASATTSCGTYSYGETEDYSVTITGGAAIAATATQAGLAAATISGDARLEMYPNPATDHLQLTLTNGADLTSVAVVDALGAKVLAAHYAGNGQLDVSGLASGLYTVLASDGQHSFSQHFVKQ
ncbi:T9SS type A sorting domain-containing protein [Hymenobacter sp. HMF4947]|uniref:T9SS type A sorting domain-containing protein n=1 Tax=Hymenobacter ginkgonis TaxID=2682976 RepID=A0A7K1TID6_9BACT|nr:M4 family metallopeptidase [Hymenobacter ginkgonis]MVN78168.1 T9SS type A sorting domain-containing protein [Hymenobacter ginkgonis]